MRPKLFALIIASAAASAAFAPATNQSALEALGAQPGSKMSFEQCRTTVDALEGVQLPRGEVRVIERGPDRIVLEVRGEGARRIRCDRLNQPHTSIDPIE